MTLIRLFSIQFTLLDENKRILYPNTQQHFYHMISTSLFSIHFTIFTQDPIFLFPPMSRISITWSLQACFQYTSPFSPKINEFYISRSTGFLTNHLYKTTFNTISILYQNQRILYHPMNRISQKWSLQAYFQYTSPF